MKENHTESIKDKNNMKYIFLAVCIIFSLLGTVYANSGSDFMQKPREINYDAAVKIANADRDRYFGVNPIPIKNQTNYKYDNLETSISMAVCIIILLMIYWLFKYLLSKKEKLNILYSKFRKRDITIQEASVLLGEDNSKGIKKSAKTKNKYLFLVAGIFLSIIYAYKTMGDSEAYFYIGSVIGCILIGLLISFILAFLFCVIFTNRSKTIKTAFVIFPILMSFLLFNNAILKNTQKRAAYDLVSLNMAEVKKHKVYALMIAQNPALEILLKKDIIAILTKHQDKQISPEQMVEVLQSGALGKEFISYFKKAGDKELYNSFKTEFNHLKINKNCAIFPLASDTSKETEDIKYQLLLSAINNPYKDTKTEGQKAERIEVLMTKVGKIYAKKGYNVNNILILFDETSGSLSKADKCQTEIDFFDAIFSLPESESVELIRNVIITAY